MKWITFILIGTLFATAFSKHIADKGRKIKHHFRQENNKRSQTESPLTDTTFKRNADDLSTALTETSDKHVTEVTTRVPEIPNCGYEVNGLSEKSGSISSPGYPNDYPDSQFCLWKIKTGPGKKLKLNFTDFEVSGSENCEGDRVVVSSSGGSLQDMHYCGTSSPPVLEVQGEDLILEFRSNEADKCKGFKVNFEVNDIEFSCGTVASAVQFLFQSPDYPEAILNETAECTIDISHECEVPICQIRLDFLDFELQPPERGDCNLDAFVVRANEPVPTLCGVNSGQHMYINVKDRASTSIHVLTSPVFPKPVGHKLDKSLQFDIAEDWEFEYNGTRRWRVKVTQIPCDCSKFELADVPRAPSGCLQYFTDIRNTFRSFNFGGTKRLLESCWLADDENCGKEVETGHLNNLDYSVCVEQRPNYCGITYTTTSNVSFAMTGMDGIGNMFGIASCQSDYIHIPQGITPNVVNGKPHDRFCGTALGNYAIGPIVSLSKPFNVQVIADEDEISTTEDVENSGFELLYQLLPCSASESFQGRISS
ncbi:dorsal-ventral patterning tolloid-like protein 1 [Artemia franciscana]